MNLTVFLDKARASGLTKFRVVADAKGTDLARGSLADATTADDITDLAKADAAHLPRETHHAYTVIAEDADGVKLSKLTVRVPGGVTLTDDVHRVDVGSSGNPQAVIGHLTRLVVEQNRVISNIATKMLDRNIAAESELGRLYRTMAKRGGQEIEAKIIDAELARDEGERRTNAERWDKALALAAPIAARLLPGGNAGALAQLRGSFTDKQLTALAEALGPVKFGKLMALDSPEKVGALLADDVSADEMAEVLAILTQEQQTLASAALQKEMNRRAAAEKAKPSTAPNGATS